MTRRHSRSRVPAWRRPLEILVIVALLGAVNAYIFVFRDGTSVRELLRTTSRGPLPPPARGSKTSGTMPSARIATSAPGPAAGAPDIEIPDEGRMSRGELGENETLSAMLKREGIPAPTALEASAALAKVFDPRNVRPARGYTLRWDGEERLRSLEYRATPATFYRVERGADGSWRASRVSVPLETQIVEVGGEIDSSLYDAVRRQGETGALVALLVDVFAWDINFFLDPQPHDQFRVIVEKQFLDGSFYKYGRILAAEYAGRVGRYRAFWYERGAPAKSGYYNDRAEAIEKSLLKTPLKYVRVSSSFNRRRFHPILHSKMAHLGVDYAAPEGTPVWATAAGRITFRGQRRGGGNCVAVAHPGGMESIYMHLSRFARGLEVGERVRQKQVIGYVGSTGLSTGPHLHLSIKLGGHYVDPLRLRPVRAPSLPAAERSAFQRAIAQRLETLGRIDVHRRPALEASAALPAM